MTPQEIEATKSKRMRFGSMPVLTEQNLQINENVEKLQDQQTYGLPNNNIFDNHPQDQSQHDLSVYAFSEDNVEVPYMEQDRTLFLRVQDAFMPTEQFMFDISSVTSGNLQAFDIDLPNELG